MNLVIRQLCLLLLASLASMLHGCKTVAISGAVKDDGKVNAASRRSGEQTGSLGATSDQSLQTLGESTLRVPTLGVPTLGTQAITTPVFAFLGGYATCKDPLQGFKSIDKSRAALLLKEAKAAAIGSGRPEPKTLLACYSAEPSTLVYKLSANPGVVRQSALPEMIAALTKLVNSVTAPEVYIVGHSYGAWAGMKLALALPATAKVRALIAVDPISSKNCLPRQFLGSLLARPTPGCIEAPKDFTVAELAAVALRVRTWLNLYETDSPFLHSGPVAAAQNSMRKYPGRGILAHGDIFDDKTLSAVILAAISK